MPISSFKSEKLSTDCGDMNGQCGAQEGCEAAREAITEKMPCSVCESYHGWLKGEGSDAELYNR